MVSDNNDPVTRGDNSPLVRARPCVLRCIGTVNPTAGGIIEAALQSSRSLRELGIDAEFASLDHPDDGHSRDFPFPLHALGTGRGGYGYSTHFADWLRSNQRKYDAAIIEGIWQYHSFGTWRALHSGETPYYVFPHGMLDPWFKHAYPLKHLKKALYWRLAEQRVLRDAAAVLFTCEDERRLASESFRPYACREEVVGLGIAAPAGDPKWQKEIFYTQYPNLKGKRLLLFLGRLHEKKGCDLLIRAFREVMERSKVKDFHLVMAGPCADAAYLRKLKQLAASMHSRSAESDVTFTGMLAGELKWGAYHAAEVFILPSHQENFGVAVVEALACGTPVLISDKVNIWREIVGHGGGLAGTDDLPGTLQLISSWLAFEEGQRIQMRSAAERCFEERFESMRAAMELARVITSRRNEPQLSEAAATPAQERWRPSGH